MCNHQLHLVDTSTILQVESRENFKLDTLHVIGLAKVLALA